MTRRVRRNTLLLAWVLWGGLSLPALVLAHPPGSPPPYKGRLERHLETLNLDAETRAQVTQIIETSKAEHRELRRKLQEAGRHMRTLLEQETPDEAAVMAQAEVMGALRTESQKLRLRTMLQIRALLTPEQRRQLQEQFSRRPPCRRRGSLLAPPEEEGGGAIPPKPLQRGKQRGEIGE